MQSHLPRVVNRGGSGHNKPRDVSNLLLFFLPPFFTVEKVAENTLKQQFEALVMVFKATVQPVQLTQVRRGASPGQDNAETNLKPKC